jgi:hypothetical protein
MKKSFLPRIISLCMVYLGIFIILVMIQFTKQGSFTQRIGDFVVSGHYGKLSTDIPNEYPLVGEVSIFFGGMEFLLTVDDDDNLSILTDGGRKEGTHPVSMSFSGESARFLLADGTELRFNSLFTAGTPELRIYAGLAPGVRRLELPYRPLRTSRIRHSGDGEFHIIADGNSYRFNNSTVDPTRRLVLLDMVDPVISYGAVPGKEIFDPAQFIISSALEKWRYDDALIHWRDQSFSLWNRNIENETEEETVLAFLAESIRRGTYTSAVSRIPRAFLEGSGRTYESSVFLGRLDQGLRSLAGSERENFSRISRLINNKSTDILNDPHIIEWLTLRGYTSLLEETAGIVRSIDPAAITLDLAPGLLEGYTDWKLCHPNTDNPFERFTDQVCFVISEEIRVDSQDERIFVFYQDEADPALNLRLGVALAVYGENAGQDIWGGIGRSLVLSVLALSNTSGEVPSTLNISESGGISAQTDVSLKAARIYRILRLGDNTARSLGISAAMNGIWAWTAATSVQANFNQESNLLDISVSFPNGETHYMLIRGIRSFQQIQLYNIPYRTDPQFERYDSSGWSYSPSEQTLMIKMKHRLTTEHIQIFY